MLTTYRARFAWKTFAGAVLLSACVLSGCGSETSQEDASTGAGAITPDETLEGIVTDKRIKSTAPLVTGIDSWDLAQVRRDGEHYGVAIGYSAEGTPLREIVMHAKQGIVIRSADPSGTALTVTKDELKAYATDVQKLREATNLLACVQAIGPAVAGLDIAAAALMTVSLETAEDCIGTFYIPVVGEVACSVALGTGIAAGLVAIGTHALAASRVLACHRAAQQ
jgi:hypothetical protein